MQIIFHSRFFPLSSETCFTKRILPRLSHFPIKCGSEILSFWNNIWFVRCITPGNKSISLISNFAHSFLFSHTIFCVPDIWFWINLSKWVCLIAIFVSGILLWSMRKSRVKRYLIFSRWTINREVKFTVFHSGNTVFAQIDSSHSMVYSEVIFFRKLKPSTEVNSIFLCPCSHIYW